MSCKIKPEQIPFVEYQGQILGDSELILQRLIKDFNIELGLSEQQLSQGRAWQQLLEQNLYWALVYSRWVPEQSWQKLEKAFFASLKWPLRPIIAQQSRKQVHKNLYAHGIGRFNLEQAMGVARQDLQALNNHFKHNHYICGEEFSYFDFFAYAIIKGIDNQQMSTPLTQVIQQFEQLKQYQARVTKQLAQGMQTKQLKSA